MERAWVELEGIEVIVKTASKAKFFIEFHSSCLEGMVSHQKRHFCLSLMQRCGKKYIAVYPNAETRRSSENDSQSCNVPGFLKLGWSFKQLPKVRGSVFLEISENTAAKNVNLHLVFFYSFFQSCLTWRLFGISTCCSLSSHVTGLSHTVGHTAK